MRGKLRKQKNVPRVVFQPAAGQGLLRGMDTLASAIRPALGPLPGIVAVQNSIHRTGSPELLDGGGTIARRMMQLPDRDADMGAMLLRGLLWRLEERVGDGTATAAVLCQAVYREGQRYVAAGGDPAGLRRGLERGLRVALDALAALAQPVHGQQALAQVAFSICHDADLAGLLGEIMDIVGEYGCLDIRDGQGRELVREYVTGTYWDQGALAPAMIAGQPKQRADLYGAAILVTDVDIDDPRTLIPVIQALLEAGHDKLLLVANSLSDNAAALLLGNRPRLFTVAVAPAGGTYDRKTACVADVALLTGARPLLKATGDTLEGFRPEYLGQARRAWIDRDHFGIIGGQGDRLAVRAQVAALKAASASTQKPDERRELRERAGKLQSGVAILTIGGVTESEVKIRRARAERTTEALRGALAEGVVPGGGAAYLACCPALAACLETAQGPDERAAYRILLRALEEPARAIMANAGVDAPAMLGEVRRAGTGYSYDVHSGQIVDMAAAGVWDCAAAAREALAGAVTTAGLALTVNVLVQRATPEQSLQPE